MITYIEFIQNILDTRGRFNCGNKYHERHHIVPRCMNGTDDKDNLIDLYAKEHFEAHRLLAIENPGNSKLVYAWWMMSTMISDNQERYQITAEEYQEARIAYSSVLSIERSGNGNPNYGKLGENNPNYGKRRSDEQKQRMGQAMKGKHIGQDSVFSKKVAQYSKNGKFIKIWECTRQVERELNISHTMISSCCIGHIQSAGGFMWRYVDDNSDPDLVIPSYDEIKKPKKSHRTKVDQYDLDGNFIQTWDYIKQAADTLQINKACISACCSGKQKTAGGFIWRYSK